MKYGIKQFSKLTIDDFNKIQNNRISSLLQISNEEITPFLDPESVSLSHAFIPFPPTSFGTKEQTLAAIQFIDTTNLNGKLEWMHLMTYYYGGQVFFRKSDKIGMCEIFYIYSETPNSVLLNRENPVFTIDGEIGFRGVWLLNMNSPGDLFLSPSISLIIEIDNEKYFNQSVAKSPIVNRVVSGFGEMKISLKFDNDDIDNDIYLNYY